MGTVHAQTLLAFVLGCAACGGAHHEPPRASGSRGEYAQYPWLDLRIESPPELVTRFGIDTAELEDRLAVAVKIGRLHRVPFQVEMVVEACGEPRASWNPADRRIRICWELIAAMSRAGSAPERAPGIAQFVALHEIGHALIDGLRLPVIGREEDSADAFGALFMIVGDNTAFVRSVIDAARFLRDTDRDLDSFWDEHSFGEARYYSLLCLVLGGSPTVGPEVAPLIPAARAERCSAEYEQTRTAWDTMTAAVD